MKLVKSGAKLPSNYASLFYTSHFEECQTISDNKFHNFVNLLINNNISIPLTGNHFQNHGGMKQKRWLLQFAFTNCHHSVWLEFEKKIMALILPLSADLCTSSSDGYSISFNQIKLFLDINPKHKFTCPAEFHYLAFASIFSQKSLMHSLLEHDLPLDQTLQCSDFWPSNHKIYLNMNNLIYANKEGNTLADLAVCSTDEKLLKKLNNINSINKFGRTPSHYAVLALLNLDQEDDLIKQNITEYFQSLGNEIGFSYGFLRNYSRHAFENSNLISHWGVEDILDSTPMGYAAMLKDGQRKDYLFNQFVNQITKFFFPILMQTLDSVVLMPTSLINMIFEYLSYVPAREDSDNLIIRWAETLINKATLFTPEFQNALIFPLQKHMKKDEKTMPNEKKVCVARTAQYLFNFIAFAGNLTPFQSILAESADSKHNYFNQSMQKIMPEFVTPAHLPMYSSAPGSPNTSTNVFAFFTTEEANANQTPIDFENVTSIKNGNSKN